MVALAVTPDLGLHGEERPTWDTSNSLIQEINGWAWVCVPFIFALGRQRPAVLCGSEPTWCAQRVLGQLVLQRETVF